MLKTKLGTITMKITLQLLAVSHFPLLFRWLKTAHVHAWWDPNINWSLKLIEEKYSSYM